MHLLTLNWADSGPGFSWPEAYHLVWFPLFDRYVVTASADSPDSWGYEDLAIGHFAPKKSRQEGVREIIMEWWRDQRDDRGQARWAYLFSDGAVGWDEANAWADEVWAVETDEEE